MSFLKLKKNGMLTGRKFTIFQKAAVINVAILSKVWYIAHTYPLPKKYRKLINKESYPFYGNLGTIRFEEKLYIKVSKTEV